MPELTKLTDADIEDHIDWMFVNEEIRYQREINDLETRFMKTFG